MYNETKVTDADPQPEKNEEVQSGHLVRILKLLFDVKLSWTRTEFKFHIGLFWIAAIVYQLAF